VTSSAQNTDAPKESTPRSWVFWRGVSIFVIQFDTTSYLCHDPNCNHYRVAAHSSHYPGSSTVNVGLRCA
jgi:formylglycine-generating enzyme required for sulfatase activity